MKERKGQRKFKGKIEMEELIVVLLPPGLLIAIIAVTGLVVAKMHGKPDDRRREKDVCDSDIEAGNGSLFGCRDDDN